MVFFFFFLHFFIPHSFRNQNALLKMAINCCCTQQRKWLLYRVWILGLSCCFFVFYKQIDVIYILMYWWYWCNLIKLIATLLPQFFSHINTFFLLLLVLLFESIFTLIFFLTALYQMKQSPVVDEKFHKIAFQHIAISTKKAWKLSNTIAAIDLSSATFKHSIVWH